MLLAIMASARTYFDYLAFSCFGFHTAEQINSSFIIVAYQASATIY